MHVSSLFENVGEMKATDLFIHSREQDRTGVLAQEANGAAQTQAMECALGKVYECTAVVSAHKTASYTAAK